MTPVHCETVWLVPGTRFTGHGHTTLHLCAVRAGGFAERIEGRWTECGPGTVRVSPGGARHDIEVGVSGLEAWMIEVPREFSRGLPHPLEASRFLSTDAMPTVWGALDRAVTACSRFEIDCASLAVAARALRHGPPGRPPAWLTALRQELDDRFGEPHSLERLAASAGHHRSHVARSFRAWFGRSIGAYLTARRAAEAERLLRTTEWPIAHIAYETGFFDQAHLTRVFGAYYGVPPGRYRCRNPS